MEAANQELRRAHDKLELLAQMDPLTEALNRHAFHSLLTRNESGSEADSSGCVAVIDIDNLKPINDTQGHQVGDKAIRAVATAVRSMIRADDMLFRWGGDVVREGTAAGRGGGDRKCSVRGGRRRVEA